MATVFNLTLRQLTGRWRLLIMTVLSLLPVLVAAVTLGLESAPSVAEFEQIVFSTMLAGSIMPLVVLAIAAAAFANELEDRTLANLTLAPVPRSQIVLPKLLAGITIAAPFAVLSALATSWIAYLGDVTAVLAITVATLVGVLLYAAAFTWLGLVTTQAIGFGLLYIVLWEGFFSTFVSGTRMLSIRYYAIALMHSLDERRFAFMSHPGTVPVIATSLIVFTGFVLLSIRRLRRMDVP